MAAKSCSDQDFILAWNKCGGSTARVAEMIGIDGRNVRKRRRTIEKNFDIALRSSVPAKITIPENRVRVNVEIESGCVVIGSDAHYWPGYIPPAHKAFVAIIAYLKPEMVVLNGDIFDGAQISRHDRIGWDHRPNVRQELEAVQARLAEIEKVSGNARLHRTYGNHDLRFETRLATVANEFDGVNGFSMRDHLPRWEDSWSILINDDCQIKHRQHNGIHAVYNNTLKSGITMVTGHLHSLKVTPWTDMRGDRYGVDTGCLADPWGPQFDYVEDGTRNWRSGFAVLTWENGVLMPPELCHILDENHARFRGVTFELNK